MDNNKSNIRQKKHDPTIAPGIENHELKESAAPEAVEKKGDYTPVHTMILDRTGDDDE